MTERGRYVVEIGHATDIDPGLRHGNDNIGVAEAEALDHHHALFEIVDHFAQQILAGDTEVHSALRQLPGDLGRRKIRHLDVLQPGDGAAIVARAARLDEWQPGTGEERFGVLLQAALGRHCNDERRAHAPLP